MAKLNISDVSSGYISVSALNNNFSAIEEAFENTLSRDGTSPNQMEAPIDMNGNRVYNLGRAVSNSDALSLAQFLEYVNVDENLTGVIPITWSFTSTGVNTYNIPLASTYQVDMYIVSSNGILINPQDYQINVIDQTISFVDSIPVLGEDIVVRLFGKIPEATASGITINNIKQSYYFDVLGAETSFVTTAGNNLDTNATDVYLNGVKLVYSSDYTLSGKNVVLVSSATAGDKIEVVVTNSIVSISDNLAAVQAAADSAVLSAAQAAISASDAATAGAAAGAAAWATGWAWSTITADDTAVAFEGFFVDTTSNPIILTLPASADVGDKVQIVDVATKFGTNALTLDRNGLKIMGLDEDMLVTVSGASFEMVYSGAINGWRIM